jgi:hypothetical protein
MTFVTFIYKLGNRRHSRFYYGKYDGYISDDHEGLDQEIRRHVKYGINKYRKQNNLKPINQIQIGILSLSVNGFIPDYSSDKEIKMFDFYQIDEDYYKSKIYVNGKLINT